MKTCSQCGNQVNDEVVFCENCGNQIGDNGTYYQNETANSAQGNTYTPNGGYGQAPNYGQVPNYNQPPVNNTNIYQMTPPKQPMSVGGWIGRSLIPCIPFVGWLIYLIMLFIWSGDQTKEDSFRNWAKAQLIVMLIGVALFILIFALILAITGGALFYGNISEKTIPSAYY